MISSFFRSHVTRLRPKIIFYRDYKNFNQQRFLADLHNTNLKSETDDPNQCFDYLTNQFSKVIDRHAPLKKKILRGNQAPFMNKEFRKEIYTRIDCATK